tara:strand:+ start:1057 stop:1578 length:522 start_codon:yes stop_codon:yes gene_type:complete
MELREIFSRDLLLSLEKCISNGIPWGLNASGTQEVTSFESFMNMFETLEKYFHRYEELENSCKKMYEERNRKWCKKDSKILIYPSGYDGLIHTDYEEEEGDYKLTTITFLNIDWDKSWGGEVLCYSKDCRVVVGGVTPEFGKTFLFNGVLPHRALAPVRLSSLLRIVLVTKEQ